MNSYSARLGRRGPFDSCFLERISPIWTEGRLSWDRVLREHIEHNHEPLEDTLRRVLREELRASDA
jgi:hypothetical protein